MVDSEGQTCFLRAAPESKHRERRNSMTQRNVGQGPGDFGAERVEVLVILVDAHEPTAGWSKVRFKSHTGS